VHERGAGERNLADTANALMERYRSGHPGMLDDILSDLALGLIDRFLEEQIE